MRVPLVQGVVVATELIRMPTGPFSTCPGIHSAMKLSIAALSFKISESFAARRQFPGDVRRRVSPLRKAIVDCDWE